MVYFFQKTIALYTHWVYNKSVERNEVKIMNEIKLQGICEIKKATSLVVA